MLAPFLCSARSKVTPEAARAFPGEGGPVILAVDIPEDIVLKAVNDWFPLAQGLIQFDPGAGLEELLAAWPTLPKEMRDVT